jgi:hypothetical protein
MFQREDKDYVYHIELKQVPVSKDDVADFLHWTLVGKGYNLQEVILMHSNLIESAQTDLIDILKTRAAVKTVKFEGLDGNPDVISLAIRAAISSIVDARVANNLPSLTVLAKDSHETNWLLSYGDNLIELETGIVVERVPKEYVCSFTGKVYADPVFLHSSSNHVEREAAISLISAGSKSPHHLSFEPPYLEPLLNFLDGLSAYKASLSFNQRQAVYCPRAIFRELYQVICIGDIETFNVLLRREPNVLNYKIPSGYHVYHLISESGSLEMAEYFYKQYPELVEFIVKSNPPESWCPKVLNKALYTELETAEPSEERLIRFFRMGARLLDLTEKHESILHLMCKKNLSVSLFKQFLSSGSELLSVQDGHGMCPVDYALKQGNEDLACFLLRVQTPQGASWERELLYKKTLQEISQKADESQSHNISKVGYVESTTSRTNPLAKPKNYGFQLRAFPSFFNPFSEDFSRLGSASTSRTGILQTAEKLEKGSK